MWISKCQAFSKFITILFLNCLRRVVIFFVDAPVSLYYMADGIRAWAVTDLPYCQISCA